MGGLEDFGGIEEVGVERRPELMGRPRPVCDADNDEAEMSSPRSKGYKKTNLLSRDTYRRRKRAELEAGKTLGSRTSGCVRRRNYSIELQTAVHTETAVHTGDDSMSCAPDDQATRHDTTQHSKTRCHRLRRLDRMAGPPYRVLRPGHPCLMR